MQGSDAGKSDGNTCICSHSLDELFRNSQDFRRTLWR